MSTRNTAWDLLERSFISVALTVRKKKNHKELGVKLVLSEHLWESSRKLLVFQ
eukprot:NODE_2239_length_379_cov_31.742063_g2229_i0.p2 GENE.NODE_2239_length_379_cov_31.742063_g2229_i0~~NODE_2239_length_379_cov_31.742063_g2229_i0.p2  ORF type:complete len:53 (+),score=7.38 NODE_2239_length_379_cov_31.742063_g2229_i0:66-224(+)